METIGKNITKQMPGKGEMWTLYAAVLASGINIYASQALSGFSLIASVFVMQMTHYY